MYHDGRSAPKDPAELEAFLDTLRPAGMWDVAFVALADNGRDPELARRLDAGHWVEYSRPQSA